MQAERPVRQRGLTEFNLAFVDGHVWVEYAFPFVDRAWRVAFILLDLSRSGPMILRDGISSRPAGFVTSASVDSLRPLRSVSLEELAVSIHFDPW